MATAKSSPDPNETTSTATSNSIHPMLSCFCRDNSGLRTHESGFGTQGSGFRMEDSTGNLRPKIRPRQWRRSLKTTPATAREGEKKEKQCGNLTRYNTKPRRKKYKQVHFEKKSLEERIPGMTKPPASSSWEQPTSHRREKKEHGEVKEKTPDSVKRR